MSKTRLIKRLEWYYPTERFHTYGTVPLLVLLVLIFDRSANVIALIYGLLVCNYILYQGQRYWKLKLFRLKGIPFDQAENLMFFKKSRKRNQLLIVMIPLVFLLQYLIAGQIDFSEKNIWWAILANFFALLEYINYYHIQLSIDNSYDVAYLKKNRRLKKASLAKDLEEGLI